MRLAAIILVVAGTPAFAAEGPFMSLFNTNYVVLLAFLLFVAVIVYLKVPALLMGLLDARAEGIRTELDAAKTLREEAQTILASYERKQREVQEQADRILAQAKTEAQAAAAQTLVDLEATIVRRLAAAQDQIASAQTAAVKEVRDTAISVAIGAASDMIAAGMGDADRKKLIDEAIAVVGDRLH